ncbi:MAG: hypothetical protein WDA18_03480 [Candidatus Ratteibacteria bacterium]|jgi:hypothetical protein
MKNLDNILKLSNDYREGTTGFAGDILFAQYIENRMGFTGTFHLFHDCSGLHLDILNKLLPIECFTDSRDEIVLEYSWQPSHIKRTAKAHYVDYTELKTISRNDAAVCEIVFYNRGIREERIHPRISGNKEGAFDIFGQKMYFTRAVFPEKPVVLAPGQQLTVVGAIAIHRDKQKAFGALRKALKPGSIKQIIKNERTFYQSTVPEFLCEDIWIERNYYYRNYVLRRNLAHPNTGNLKHYVFYEGKQAGYSRLITASACIALDEVRWWKKPEYGYGQMHNCIENLPEHGIFRDIWINNVRDLSWPGYEEWISRAMADFLLVHPDDKMARSVIETGYRNIYGLLKEKDKNANLLLNPGGHHMTQEHSPAFTYFHNYRDWYDYTELERIEYQAFFYGNIIGIARLMQIYGDSRVSELIELAEKVRERSLKACWDSDDRFFYAIRESDGLKARCKEANGFLAFIFGLAPFSKPYADIFDYLVSDCFFWNPYPLASCSKDVPSYSPHQQMWGDQKKNAGCTWSGPTWPYINSLIITVLAEALRSGVPCAISREHLRNFFTLFTQGHWENGHPMIRESWDGLNGKQSGCPDYLHSTYIDLVVRYVMGVDLESGPSAGLKPMMGINAEIRELPWGGKLWNIKVDADGKGKAHLA